MSKTPTDTEVEDALRNLDAFAEPLAGASRTDFWAATLRAALAAKDAEIERLWDVNHSVAVCAAHVREIADPSGLTSGCWRCTVEEQQEQLAAKDAEIERLRARLKSNREMYQRGHAAGFREAADWLDDPGRLDIRHPQFLPYFADVLRAEADRREGIENNNAKPEDGGRR